MSKQQSKWSNATSMVPKPQMASLGGDPEESEFMDDLLPTVLRYAAQHIDALAIDAAHHIEPKILSDLAEMGLFGLSIPAKFGGAGFSMQAVCSVVQTLAAADRSVATTVGLHLGLGTQGLVAFGSAELQERLLPELALGRRLAAFAATEPGAGSDLYGVRTTLDRVDGKLIVNGSKIFVTNGALAEVFTTVCRERDADGKRGGHTIVVAERGQQGISTGAEERKLGIRGSSTTTLQLDDVVVSPECVLGQAGQGAGLLSHILAWGRTAMSAGCVGTGQAALEKTVRHVHQRRQFGKLLAQQEVVQKQLADMAALQFAMLAIVRHACAAEHTPGLLETRSLAAKIFCSEGAGELCDVALQLHGGSGFIEETGIPLLVRDTRITRIFEGANDVLAGLMGVRTITLEGRVAPTHDSDLARQARALSDEVDTRRSQLWNRHRMRLLRRHWLVHQLGRLAVLREVTDATVYRALAEGDPTSIALAEHWLVMARERTRSLLVDCTKQSSISTIISSMTAS